MTLPFCTAHRLRYVCTVALLAGVVLVEAPRRAAAAAPSLRWAAVLHEEMDGVPQAGSAADQELSRRLVAAGQAFIDEAQSRRVRSATESGELPAGGVAAVITALDADLLVLGRCQLSRVRSDLLGADVARYDAALQARVIAVDTGEVLGSFAKRGAGMDFVPLQAAHKAARAAAAKLAPDLLTLAASRGAGGGRVELVVQGLPGVGAGERLLAAVAAVHSVHKARVLAAGRGRTKLELTVAPGSDARSVALELDAQPELGLDVYGTATGSILAAYAAERVLRLGLVVGRFTGPGRAPWSPRLVGEVLATALSAAPLLEVPPDGAHDLPADAGAARWKGALVSAGLTPERSLVLGGSVRRVDDGVHVQARLVAVSSGGVLVADQATCAGAATGDCLVGLGQRMAGRVTLDALRAQRRLFPGLSAPRAARPGAPAWGGGQRPVEILAVQIEEIFPSRLQAYAQRPLGTVRVRNRGTEAATGLVLRAALRGFSTGPVDSDPIDLAPGAEASLPVRLVLDVAALRAHTQSSPSVAELDLEYGLGELRVRQRRRQPVLVYERNAMSWAQPDTLAAFVTHRAEAVAGLARGLGGSVPAGLRGDPLALPAALYLGLGRLGLRYAADPANPFGAVRLDTVQFPVQTVTNGAGDCDDLAVLYAALAEAAGVSALLIVTPEHVLAAVPTGLPPGAAHLLALDPARVILHAGRVWVPVETTLLGGSFAEAWERGAAALTPWRDRWELVRVVDVRSAWASHPAVDLAAPSARAPSVDLPPAAVQAELDALTASLKAGAEKRVAALTTPSKERTLASTGNERGLLLAALGRLPEAAAAFELAAQAPKAGVEPWNNLGNLEMLQAHPEAARARYEQALARDSARPPIHRNAALAAHAAGDEAAFSEHVFGCLAAGGEELVRELTHLGPGAGGAARGADAAGASRSGASLRQALRETLRRGGRSDLDRSETAAAATGPRASDAAAADGGLSDYLLWL